MLGKKMIRFLVFFLLLSPLVLAQGPKPDPAQQPGPKPNQPKTPPKKWLTLSGKEPLIIARGGFSGLFPEASTYAMDMLNTVSLAETVNFCNLKLTKDGLGICLTDIRLDNETIIADLFPKDKKTYNVNGKPVEGWFSIDYPIDTLVNNVTLIQNVLSRPSAFDGQLNVSSLDAMTQTRPGPLWVHVEHDMFYNENKLSATLYIQDTLRLMPIDYLSSPEIGFLKNIGGKLRRAKTKLIFSLQDVNVVEPTTNQTYGNIIKDLPSIKSFAAGILVPKGYIWPVDTNNYLQPPSTLVADAHKAGLEVYASGFANDYSYSFNYTYDPVAEYLQFIDNSKFSVDGFVTDFPSTASEAIVCFAQNQNGTRPSKDNTLIISHNGASGVYPASTDMAYNQAIEDGADIIDCNVQLTKDGVAICLSSPDLVPSSNAMTTFMSQATTIPEIKNDNGIFAFDLSWSDIQTLTPQIESPFSKEGLPRNPINKNKGKFITLSDFLELAKGKGVSGILINIENAAYLASNKGLGVVDAVKDALSNATFDKQSTQKVFIQSDDTSVLSMFKDVPTYKRVLYIKEKIDNVPKEAVDEIKKYADAVDLRRTSILPTINYFLDNATLVLKQFHDANISVHISVFRNEFTTLAIDYFSDPTFEIATFAKLGVDAIVTDFPATASRYIRSPCSDPTKDKELPYTILPAEGGSLLSLVPHQALAPPAEAEAPSTPLTAKNIVDPPLPPVAKNGSNPTPPPGGAKSSGFANVANLGITLGAILVLSTVGY